MGYKSEYKSEVETFYKKKLDDMLNELPYYIRTYISGRENRISVKTQHAYALDLKIFLGFVKRSNPLYKNTDIKDIPLEALDQLQSLDITEFLKSLDYYESGNGIRQNDKKSKQRKLATLRSFYKFCNVNRILDNNPTLAVENIRLEQKDIVALETDEVQDFLDVVQNGIGFKGKKLSIQKKNADHRRKRRPSSFRGSYISSYRALYI